MVSLSPPREKPAAFIDYLQVCYTSDLGPPEHVSSQPNDECLIIIAWPSKTPLRVVLDSRSATPFTKADPRDATRRHALTPEALKGELRRAAELIRDVQRGERAQHELAALVATFGGGARG